MSALQIVAGATDHYGRAELVTLTARNGAPVLLDRRTAALIDPSLPGAPYHHEALELDLAAGTELVDRVRRSVAEFAQAAISELVASHGVQALILPESPYAELPASLSDVLSSRPLTNAADGMLYRETLAEAAATQGLFVERYARKIDPTGLAADALDVDVAAVETEIARMGQEVGPPWRKDHKRAAAAALSLLGPLIRLGRSRA